jgi:hypothetical protein
VNVLNGLAAIGAGVEHKAETVWVVLRGDLGRKGQQVARKLGICGR